MGGSTLVAEPASRSEPSGPSTGSELRRERPAERDDAARRTEDGATRGALPAFLRSPSAAPPRPPERSPLRTIEAVTAGAPATTEGLDAMSAVLPATGALVRAGRDGAVDAVAPGGASARTAAPPAEPGAAEADRNGAGAATPQDGATGGAAGAPGGTAAGGAAGGPAAGPGAAMAAGGPTGAARRTVAAGGMGAGAAGAGAPDVASLDALSTANVALIDEELAEHQRWGAASARVGSAGSATRAQFIAEQADAGVVGGGAQAFATGLGMGAATRALEIAGERGAMRLAGQTLGRTAPIPAIGAVIGGVMSAMDLAERDWGATGETIGRFGQGSSDYETLANSIAAVSEILTVYTSVLNVIAGVIGAISIAMWIITVVTVGIASPLAATLSTIAGAIGLGTMILDGINALVLQPLVTTFRALHAFKSQADPTAVEEQGAQVRQSAAAGAGFIGGFAGGLAGSAGANAAGRRAGLVPPHTTPTPHDTPPAATGDGPAIHADPPPVDAAPHAADGPAPVADGPAASPHDIAPAAGEGAPRQPGDPILPPADPTVPVPDIPGPPRLPEIEPPAPGTPLDPDTHPVSPDRPTQPAPADPSVDPYRLTDPAPALEATAPAREGGPESSRGPAPDEFRMVDDEPAGSGSRESSPVEAPEARSDRRRATELEPTPEQLAELGMTPDQYEIARDMGLTGVEPELNATPGPSRRHMGPGERMPGRLETPSRVRSDARRRARAGFEERMAAALQDEGQLTPEMHETIDRMRPDQRIEMEETRSLPDNEPRADLDAQAEAEGLPPGSPVGMPGPRGPGAFDVRHIETVADSPHTAHLGEQTTAAPHAEHMMIDHRMDGTFPLEASTPRDPNALETHGWQLDPRAERPAARATDSNPSGRLPPEHDFGRRPATDENIVAETRRRAAETTDPVERGRLLDAATELERLSAEDRARASAEIISEDTHHMADPAGPTAPGGATPAARPPTRSTRPLTPAERTQMLQTAAELGYPPERVVFHDGQTSVRAGVLHIGPDVNPLPPGERPQGVVNPANTAVEAPGVLAHEILGHIEARQMGQTRPERWHEEFQASTRAALHAPDSLPADQRGLLRADAAARLRGQTRPGTIFIETGRPGGATPDAPVTRPPEHFRPQDQQPSVIVDWNALGTRPPEPGAPGATAATRPPVRPSSGRTGGPPEGGSQAFADTPSAGPRVAAGRPAGSGLGATIDSMRHGYVGTIAGGLWSAVPGVEQVHRVGRIGSAWFGDDRMRPPPGRRDAMGNVVGYSAAERRAIGTGGSVGAVLGGIAGGTMGANAGRLIGEGVTRRGADFAEGLTRGATEPIVERVNPSYPPPPEGGYDQINALQERLARILAARAQAEAAGAAAQQDTSHHQANAAPLTQFDQQTTQSITATQAHEAATQRRQAANAQRQQGESDASAALADASQRRSGLSTLTIPMEGLAAFASLGESLPDGIPIAPQGLVGPKRKLRQLNTDSTDFLNALNGVDSTITEQQGATGPRQQETEDHGGRLGATQAGAVASQASLQGTQQQGQALAQRNQQRTDESRRLAGGAASQGARLEGEAQNTEQQIQSTSDRWQSWATAHRAARQAAIDQRRRAMEERGYRVREVSGR